MVQIGNDWDELLADEFNKEYYLKLRKFLKKEYGSYEIYPDMYDIFNALKYTAYKDVKVVIIGQDPYHEPGQAHGLAFSVLRDTPVPPSLNNIYKELRNDLGIPIATHGELIPWTQEGVLLMNSVLTVRRGEANSHKGMGWEIFTDRVIELLNEREKPMVFMLWGRNARDKAQLITNPAHLVLQAAHPSPLSAYNGFFGCRHFSRANTFLAINHIEPIDWQIE